MIEVSAIKCPCCEFTIFSRARHDFHSCPCKKVSIDGGFDYVRLSSSPDIGVPKVFKLKIEQTPLELYNDWNTRQEKYGRIPPEDERNKGEESMNIHAKKGTKVVFSHPDAGLPFERKDAKEKLTIGATYTVECTNVHSFKTCVYLQEVPYTPFNSVLFEEAK